MKWIVIGGLMLVAIAACVILVVAAATAANTSDTPPSAGATPQPKISPKFNRPTPLRGPVSSGPPCPTLPPAVTALENTRPGPTPFMGCFNNTARSFGGAGPG